MLKIKKDALAYAFCPENKPAAFACSGDTVQFETLDCFAGQVRREEQCVADIDWDHINPTTGPLFIRDAMPGDTLKVEILSIDVAEQAVTAELPGEGITGLAAKAANTKILPITAEGAVFNSKITLALKPMIGVIGTSPAEGSVPNGTPGTHGGNMDCTRIGAGTTLYLPVNVEGALLAMGDLHAVMGDGEVCVCGAEIDGLVTVRVTVLKNAGLPLPFLLTDTAAMAIFSGDSLDSAAEGAAMRMRSFLIERVGMAEYEAGMLLSLAGDLRVCQAVDPQKTCRMELPRSMTDALGYAFP